MAAAPAAATARELKRKIRAEDRRLQRQQRVLDFKLHWSQSQADVAFLIALAHEADDFLSAATAYLHHRAQRTSRRKPASDPGAQAESFYRTWLSTPQDSPHYAFRKGQLAAARVAARTWLVEWRARQWVAEVNRSKGCAPSTEQVRARYEQDLQRSGTSDAGALSLARCASWRKVWGCRWRKRWRVRLGGLQTKEDLPQADLAAKAVWA